VCRQLAQLSYVVCNGDDRADRADEKGGVRGPGIVGGSARHAPCARGFECLTF